MDGKGILGERAHAMTATTIEHSNINVISRMASLILLQIVLLSLDTFIIFLGSALSGLKEENVDGRLIQGMRKVDRLSQFEFIAKRAREKGKVWIQYLKARTNIIYSCCSSSLD